VPGKALANVGSVCDGVDEDVDTVGPVVQGHRSSGREDEDVGVGLVLESSPVSWTPAAVTSKELIVYSACVRDAEPY
jgi:hypothetical protein